MRKLLAAAALVAALAAPAAAQPPQAISVDIDRALFQWTWSLGTGGALAEFRIKCGAATGQYTTTFVHRPALPPATSVFLQPVKPVITAPGTYFCVVTAANQFGESNPTNEVQFTAGSRPVAPTNLGITTQP